MGLCGVTWKIQLRLTPEVTTKFELDGEPAMETETVRQREKQEESAVRWVSREENIKQGEINWRMLPKGQKMIRAISVE